MRSLRRSAFTLVEVMVSVAVLGLALAPVVGMMHKSFGEIRAEKDEATAAGIAGQLLNQILFEVPFDAIVSNSYTSPALPPDPPQQLLPGGNKTVDGTYIEWAVDRTPMTGLQFKYRRFKYHQHHGSSQEPALGAGMFNDTSKFYVDPVSSSTLYNKAASDIDRKYLGLPAVMYEIRLNVRWRPPGATAFTKEEKLYVRRAKLD